MFFLHSFFLDALVVVGARQKLHFHPQTVGEDTNIVAFDKLSFDMIFDIARVWYGGLGGWFVMERIGTH